MADTKLQRGSDGKIRRGSDGKVKTHDPASPQACCCAAFPCLFCISTPLSYTITITGIILCGSPHVWVGNPNGTFTIPNTSNCQYRLAIPGVTCDGSQMYWTIQIAVGPGLGIACTDLASTLSAYQDNAVTLANCNSIGSSSSSNVTCGTGTVGTGGSGSATPNF